MSLEQFKTQVLLLHSEQSALDKLSAGFDDSYTVHCATTGFEALNTLGETPIHVIVSANALPGMSGAEALREAKKRSPDTVGILITGNDDSQFEALASDKEIFQVIRGGVDPKDITKLIEAATQQMRLMAMADSANDQAADIDEGTAEHIVIETDDHGSTIVSDGTGQHAILDPGKLSESSPVGAQAVGILLMTKDEQFLDSIKDCCRGMHTVHTASTIKQAQELIQESKVGVSIVDAAMVGPNVEKLTSHLQSLQKRLVTIVAGRREDGDMLMDLINRGKVYRFLLKPVSPGRVRLAVDASVRHHLDSPDSAFKKVGQQPAKEPAAPKPAAPEKPPKAQKKEPAESSVPAPNLITDGLADAFDEDDTRFAETVSGILTGIGRSKKKDDEPAPSPMHFAEDSGSTPGNPMIKVGIAAAVVIVGALGFWMMSGNDEAPETAGPAQQAEIEETSRPSQSVATEPTSVSASPEPAAIEESTIDEPAVDQPSASRPAADRPAVRDSGLVALLASAGDALATDRIFTPVDDNALELYSRALVLAPNDAAAQAGFDEALDAAISAIEAALIERRLEVVEAGVRQVGLVQPDHPRLPFLIAQANQAKAMVALDDARAAIGDGRYEDAATAIEEAREAGANAGTLESLQAELETARSSQEVSEILSLANRRLAQGRLLSPSNDNARYLFELVLKNDSDNAAARQGLTAVAAKLAVNAQSEIVAGRFTQAESLIRQAAGIDSDSQEVAASRRALSDARAAVQQRAADQAEREKLAAEREAQEAAAAAAAEAAKPVPVSSLTRVKYVSPKYPRAAERRGISGWVDVYFTVSLDGTVRDVEVRDSLPGDTFVASAVAAVERWEFEPVRENGAVVEKRAGVRLMFALE